MSYSFEAGTATVLPSDLNEFKDRFKLTDVFDKLSEENQLLIETFCAQTIRAITWYKKRIAKETRWSHLYNILTLILLIGIPVFIFKTTMVDEETRTNLEYLQFMGSAITVVVTSVLAVHKFITSWIEKRKFRSLFHSASVDLQSVLYGLEGEFKHTALGAPDFEHGPNFEGDFLSTKFESALKKGITDARAIMAAETKAFFDAQANPSFDIGSALKTSAATATSLVKSLKSGNFDQEEAKKRAGEEATHKDQLEGYELQLELNKQKLEKLSLRDEELSIQIDALEDLDKPTNDEFQKTEVLIERLSKVEAEEEEIAFKCSELEIRIRHSQSKLNA